MQFNMHLRAVSRKALKICTYMYSMSDSPVTEQSCAIYLQYIQCVNGQKIT